MKSEPLRCTKEAKSEWAHISWKEIELPTANATKALCSEATWLLQCALKAVTHGDVIKTIRCDYLAFGSSSYPDSGKKKKV